MNHMAQTHVSPACSRKSGRVSSRLETALHAALISAAFVFVAAVVLGMLPA